MATSFQQGNHKANWMESEEQCRVKNMQKGKDIGEQEVEEVKGPNISNITSVARAIPEIRIQKETYLKCFSITEDNFCQKLAIYGACGHG